MSTSHNAPYFSSTFFLFFLFSLFIGIGITTSPPIQHLQASALFPPHQKDIYTHKYYARLSNPKKFVIRGTFVIEQENKIDQENDQPHNPEPKHHPEQQPQPKTNHYPEQQPQPKTKHYPEQQPQAAHITKLPQDFKFTQEHKNNIRNVYIDLKHQTECVRSSQRQCWNSIIEFEKNTTLYTVLVAVDYIATSTCKLVLCPQCIHKIGIPGYKMTCEQQQKKQHLNVITPNDNILVAPHNGVFFLLKEGNYHSSWQVITNLDPKVYDNAKATQEVMKKFNFYQHLDRDEMLLSYTTIMHKTPAEMNNGRGWSRLVYKRYIKSKGTYVSLSTSIEVIRNFDLPALFHERIHEFIRPEITSNVVIQYGNQYLFVGKKTVDLVLRDAQNNPSLNNNIVRVGDRYGLKMQDSGHLGNWGPGSSASSYSSYWNRYYDLGKFTMAAINDIGYYMI